LTLNIYAKGNEFLPQTPTVFLATRCRRISERSNSRLKYHRFTPSGCKDIGMRKYEFVAKT